jgi:hypothetical protein
MPAASASPIHPVVDHLIDAVDHQRVGRGVLTALKVVPDPRMPRGIRHQLTTILALAVCAVMAGCRSFTAIGEWAAAASEQVLSALGAQSAPSESTMRRCLQLVDGDQLDSAIGSWAAERTEPGGTRRRLVAVVASGSAARATAPLARGICWPPLITPTPWFWRSGRWAARPTRSPSSHPCSTTST